MRLGAYARASTDEQSASPDTQLQHIRYWAKLNDHIIVEEYIDLGISGGVSPNDRPAFKKLLQDAKSHLIDGIVCLRLDRLSRDLEQLLAFERQSRKASLAIHFVAETYDDSPGGRLMMQLMGAFNEHYRRDIAKKIDDRRVLVARQGRNPGGIVPLGYLYDPVTKEITVDPVRSISAIRLFEAFIDCAGNRHETARVLNQAGIPTARNGRWSAATITKTVRSRYYRGIISYKGMETASPDIPIFVPLPLLETADLLLSHRQGRKSRAQKSVKAYTGILRCSTCGGKMTVGGGCRRKGETWAEWEGFQWQCPDRFAGRCTGRAIVNRRIDKLVMRGMESALKAHRKQIEKASGRRQAKGEVLAQLELASLREKRARLIDMRVDGTISAGELKSRLDDLDMQIKRMEKEPKPKGVPEDMLAAMYNNFKGFWGALAPEEKNKIMTLLCPVVVVYPGEKYGKARVVLHIALGVGAVEVSE
jgi:DNA invertase Pin-like site-specific DNA recombinase